MAKLRLNPLSSKEIEVKHNYDEKISTLIDRVVSENNLPEDAKKYLEVIVDGYLISKELWPYIRVKHGHDILIATRPRGGSFGEIVKLGAIIAITAYSGGALTPVLGAGSVGLGLAVAGIGIASSLILNALIPPPVVGGNLGGTSTAQEESQMYSISGQSNSVNKYGYVPKVYGKHRMFPNVVANPYTELEADSVSGELVQYLYAVYDFGFGPAIVSDLRIGDTPISDFSDISYRFIDFNRPDSDEGEWDLFLNKELVYYKGDVEQDNVGVSLNGNLFSDDDISEYEIIRNASNLAGGDEQEITINLVCQNGLNSYATNGNRGTSTIELSVSFAEDGSDDWLAYNNEQFVKDFKVFGASNGGGVVETISPYFVFKSPEAFFYGMTRLYRGPTVRNRSFTGYSVYDYNASFGYVAGQTEIYCIGDIKVGSVIEKNGDIIGEVGAFEFLDYAYNGAGAITSIKAYKITLVEPIQRDIEIISGIVRSTGNGIPFFVYGNYTNYYFYALNSTTDRRGKGFWPRSNDGEHNTDFYSYQYGTASFSATNLLSKFTEGGKVVISENKTSAVFLTIKIIPRDSTKNYRVRIQRLRSYSQYSYQINNSLTFSSIVTRFDRNPITTKKRHVFLEIKIRATGQLNGTISNLSGVVSSVLDTYDVDTQSWIKKETSNPAWIFADMITSEVNKRALPKSRLDTSSLLEWASFSDEIPTSTNPEFEFSLPRFSINFVLDFSTTLQSIISQVCSSAQASLNMVDGKYGVLIDKRKDVPVQMFTPRNSWNFSLNRSYSEQPHAIKVKYVDVGSNWELIEQIVYSDGYDYETATEFDELETFGVTNNEQAFRFGRYMMAQAKLRQETITIDVDFEHLLCTRGDYVKITNDVMLVGGTPCRVSSVSANRITIDDRIDFDVLSSYGYTFRNSLGQIKTDTLTIINSNTFDVDGDIPSVGDLLVVGEVDKLTFDCIVKSITPNSDLSATVVLVEKADAIYDAESGGLIEEYEPQLTPVRNTESSAPNPIEDLTVNNNDWECFGGGYRYYIDLSWSVPRGSAYEIFEVYVNSGTGYNLFDYTKKTAYKYYVEEEDLGVEHSFKILAVSSFGSKINLSEAEFVTATPLRKTSRPSNVESLFINVTNEIIQLNWPSVRDCDVAEYLIRYSPKNDSSWESSIPLLRVDKNTTLASAQARTGTYLIKAVDWNGNESEIASKAITSIPSLINLNIIEETNDFPNLYGSMSKVVKLGEALLLQEKANGDPTLTEYWDIGYYYYDAFLDLGEIYTVRLQSLIEAEGFTPDDVMSNWLTLEDVEFLSNAKFSEWDVETQVRYTDSFNVISDWTSLEDVVTLSEGQEDLWSDWKSFSQGDFTGRIFQFRLKLISNVASVTPRVLEGKIKADMPDRIESYSNATCPIGGTTIIFDKAFKGPDSGLAINITQDNAQSGDRYVLTKTLSSFSIEFFDKDDNSVERTFDAYVKGYGRKSNTVI